jgi:catechol 2,3-dioxygenase-like lactoylglutathione lyase family enzyme
MSIDLHHAHVFATSIDATIQWWCGHLGAKVYFDDRLAGSRNVFLAVGTGRLNIYDQAPRDQGRGAIHHLGVKVANLRYVCKPRASRHPMGCESGTAGGMS